jgi:galactose mutarotase-like enzyme
MATNRFAVERRAGAIPQLALIDRESNSEALLAPERGGMLSRWRCGGREVLFLDEATFLDKSKNVRGGNPVLFPTPGKLEGDAWSRGGQRGALKQHGFARTSAWSEEGTGVDARAWAKIALASSPATLADYPWPFRSELTYAVQGRSLRIEIRVQNTGSTRMPFGFGFHPYFAVPQAAKAAARVETRATRAWDNAGKKEIALSGIDLTAAEVDLHLRDHGSTQSALSFDGARIELLGSPEFAQWVVWTLAGKDFVCLEPWTGPGNALNMGVGLIELEPGAEKALWLELRA